MANRIRNLKNLSIHRLRHEVTDKDVQVVGGDLRVLYTEFPWEREMEANSWGNSVFDTSCALKAAMLLASHKRNTG